MRESTCEQPDVEEIGSHRPGLNCEADILDGIWDQWAALLHEQDDRRVLLHTSKRMQCFDDKPIQIRDLA